MTYGIYILANDVVYDQLVALLNSIEANISVEMPVCVIPYNDRLDRTRAEIAQRPHVTLFEDTDAIAYWENFAIRAWKAHPKAYAVWEARGLSEAARLSRHRRLCAFDGPFDRFIYFDADTLAMGPVDEVFQKLDQYDWVTNDFQYKSDLHYVLDAPQEKLLQVFSADILKSHVFCSGWFASRKDVFNRERIADLLSKLEAGEAELLSLRCIDQPLLNYMVMRSGIAYYNYAYDGKATGNHWSSTFDIEDQVLYDRGRRLTYIHFMSLSSSQFAKLSTGEDVGLPYQDLFLHYRYLKNPQQRPQTLVREPWVSRTQKALTSLLEQKISNAKRKLQNLKA
jgi:hypothetical protein